MENYLFFVSEKATILLSGNIGILFICLCRFLCVCFRKVFFVHFFMGDPLPKFETFWRKNPSNHLFIVREPYYSQFLLTFIRGCQGLDFISVQWSHYWFCLWPICWVLPLATQMLEKSIFCHPKHFYTQKTDVVSQDCSGMYVRLYPFFISMGIFSVLNHSVYHTHFIIVLLP